MKQNTSKSEIVKQALILFHQKGFFETSFADIAKACNILKGNIAYYFKSKDLVLNETIRQLKSNLKSFINSDETLELSPNDRIIRFLDFIAFNAYVLQSYGCPIASLSLSLGRSKHEMQEQIKQIFDGIEEFLYNNLKVNREELAAKKIALNILCDLEGAIIIAQIKRDKSIVLDKIDAIKTIL